MVLILGAWISFFFYLILKWGLQDDLTTDLVRVFGHIVLGDIKGKIDLVFLIKGPTIGMSQLLLASCTVSELGSVLDKEDGWPVLILEKNKEFPCD